MKVSLSRLSSVAVLLCWTASSLLGEDLSKSTEPTNQIVALEVSGITIGMPLPEVITRLKDAGFTGIGKKELQSRARGPLIDACGDFVKRAACSLEAKVTYARSPGPIQTIAPLHLAAPH